MKHVNRLGKRSSNLWADREMINKVIRDIIDAHLDRLKRGETLRATSKPHNKYRVTVKMPNPTVEEYDVEVEGR